MAVSVTVSDEHSSNDVTVPFMREGKPVSHRFNSSLIHLGVIREYREEDYGCIRKKKIRKKSRVMVASLPPYRNQEKMQLGSV